MGNEKIYMVDVQIEKDELEIPIALEMLKADLSTVNSDWGFEEPKVCLIPASKREMFNKFEEKVRQDLKDTAIEYPFGEQLLFYMTEKDLEGFSKRLKLYEQEYYQMRDTVVSEYENLKEKLLSDLSSTLSGEREKQSLIKKIKDSIPSKEKFGNSFKIRIDKMDATSTVMANEDIKAQFIK